MLHVVMMGKQPAPARQVTYQWTRELYYRSGKEKKERLKRTGQAFLRR
jgi:hypothetical protein